MIQEDIQLVSDGINHFAHCWKPEKEIKTAITLVHGFGEHCMRYTNYLESFTKHGFAILAFDHQGHGQSEGKRGVINSYESLLNGLETAVLKTKELFPDSPQFLYGHSMGGNLALNYLIRRNNKLNGAIVTSPWLTLTEEPNMFIKSLINLFSKLIPKTTIKSNLDINYLSTIKEEVTKYANDPLVHGKISFQLLNDIIKSGLWAKKNANKINIPTILMHGSNDRITSPISSKIAAGKSEFIEFKEWEGGYHELQNDFCSKKLSEEIIKWIAQRI